MDSKEIIELIRMHKRELEKFGVKRIGIFGSFARGEASGESDIDVVVEFERGKGHIQELRRLGGVSRESFW